MRFFVRLCPICGDQEFRRLPRDGVFERSILPVLGLFPWECRSCQRKTYMRLRGEKRMAPTAQEVTRNKE